MTSIRLALGTVCLCISFNASAKPLSFHDLDWSMSATTMSDVLKSKNYSCKFERYDDVSSVWNCTKSNGSLVRIFEDQPFSPDQILFTCKVFNGCDHPFYVLENAITERLNIQPDYDLPTKSTIWYGTEGDQLRLSPNWDGDLLFPISLEKGYYGEKLDF
jgi:hypothetical protein